MFPPFFHWLLVHENAEERKGKMTQHKWKTLDGWEVLTGWDRMLQHFFLDIGRHNADRESGREYVFNNLEDLTGMTDRMGGMSIQQVQGVLEQYLTEYPPNLLFVLSEECAKDVGNSITKYPAIGKVKQQ